MANRRRLLDQQQQQQPAALQPKPQFRKFGADSSTWKRPQPAAVPSGGGGWLLVPSGPWQASLEGYLCIVSALPNRPFLTPVDDFEYADNNKLRLKTKTENGQQLINSYGSYSTQGFQAVPGRILQAATFEGFVNTSGVAPTAVSGFYDFIGYWEYEYVVSIFDPGGRPEGLPNPYQQTRYLRFTDPSGVRRPDPPSEHFTWPQIATDAEGNVETITSFVSETLVYTTQPEVREQYVLAYSDLSMRIAFTSANEEEVVLTLEGILLMQVSSQEGSTNTIASAVVNGENQGVAIDPSGSQRLHYAFAVTPEAITGYINGQRLLTAQNPGINPETLYSIELVVSAGAQDFDQALEVPDSPFALGDSIISNGYVRYADASRHSVSGIRFTPGRALYRGPSFTPPSSITRLA